MSAVSSGRRLPAGASLKPALFGVLLATLGVACGSDDDAPSTTGNTGGAGSGGTVATGAGLGSSAGTGIAPSVGGSGAAKGGAGGAGGTGSQAGHAPTTGGGAGTGGSARGGGGGLSGSSSAAAAGGRSGPPAPNDDGSSPYDRECHGDTIECVDVEALRCLGIRDDANIYGYSCSNTCETDADCSMAPSSGEAKAGCVDFVTQKHCLLLCLSGGTMHSCPEGMGCYVYPQSPVGYCLWQ